MLKVNGSLPCLNIHYIHSSGCTINHARGSNLKAIRINVVMYRLVAWICKTKVADKILNVELSCFDVYISNLCKLRKNPYYFVATSNLVLQRSIF